jgi:hypothetical protein
MDAYREAPAEYRRIVRGACAPATKATRSTLRPTLLLRHLQRARPVSAISEAMAAPGDGPIRIRVGIHTGHPSLDAPKHVGLHVHRAAPTMSSAHGGHVVMSAATGERIADGFPLTDVGEHQLNDIAVPERLNRSWWTYPPLRSLYRRKLPAPPPTFVGGDRELGAVTGLLVDPRKVDADARAGSPSRRDACAGRRERRRRSGLPASRPRFPVVGGGLTREPAMFG